MTITIHQVDQGTDEWLALRCGIVTASEVKLLMTPTHKAAANDKSRAHVYELIGQRLTKHVEPSYISSDMLRGMNDEIKAREKYETTQRVTVHQAGFITNDKWGFTIGYSPDGLVGADGQIEVKSRCQKYQVQTVINNAIPGEFYLQIQTGLLVSEREWCDFISYCGGLPMAIIRAHADDKVMDAIVNTVADVERQIRLGMSVFNECVQSLGYPATERETEQGEGYNWNLEAD